jgi:hypothetical protein
MGKAPGQYAARILIENRRQEPPTPRHREIGKVADPDLIRSRRVGPSYMIRMLASLKALELNRRGFNYAHS